MKGAWRTYSATSPAKGDWSGIIVQPGAAATLEECDLRHGAYTGSGGTLAMIKADRLSLTVRDSAISDSANYGYGIKVSAGSLDLTGTRLTRNAWGVYLNTLGSVTVRNNCFAGNAYDATLNWWGNPSGPSPLGTGDYAYDAPTNLAVSPWLEYDPTLALPKVTLNVPPTFEVMLAMAAEVTSEVAIDRVEFCWDHDGESTLLGTVEEAPFCFSWKPTVQLEAVDYEPGAFGDRVVRAVAYDLRGRGGSHIQLTTQSPALHLPVAADAEGVPKVIYRYFDLDPDVGVIIDWRGGQVTYDGHTGTDYDWPPQSEVRASRGGVVTAARSDCPDLPDPDGGYGNYVKILHDALDDWQYVLHFVRPHDERVCHVAARR